MLAAVLVAVLAAGTMVAVKLDDHSNRMSIVGYFDNSTGLFAGDDVRIRGVTVGKVDTIEPEAQRAKITFWIDRKFAVPAEAKAVILSPQLVTGRAIQLTPPYSGGPTMAGGAVIPQDRTAVPVEWDDVRAQLERLTDMLAPTEPGGVSTLGAVINTAADNLRGQGATIRDSIITLSQTMSALGDHSKDIFGTVRNLATLVTALRSDLLSQLNVNLSQVSGLLADNPHEVGQAVQDLNAVVGDVRTFVAENREPIGSASDKLASISAAVVGSLGDLEQTLHVLPTVMANFNNIYEPANGSLGLTPGGGHLIAGLLVLRGGCSRVGKPQEVHPGVSRAGRAPGRRYWTPDRARRRGDRRWRTIARPVGRGGQSALGSR
ncbi:MCE family protein [Mycolicibacterium frederiksbergense]|uniref:MCE family protein n=1 Tax=Mycolicibacterium frederiksbergense TaxID=117567 RepID=UPI003F583D22